MPTLESLRPSLTVWSENTPPPPSFRKFGKWLKRRLRQISSKLRGLWPRKKVLAANDQENPMEGEMRIRGVMMDPVTNMPVVILKGIEGDSILPIWVGIYEANAIALEMEKVATPRPMTHDLLKNLLIGLDAQVRKVVVNDLRDDTFFSVIWLEKEGQTISIDSRPSDALALALRADCPIFVEEEVLKTSKQASAISDKVSSEELRKWLENLGEEDMGRYKM